MRLCCLILAALALGGCAAPSGAGAPSGPAPLLHLVVFTLDDPAGAHSLKADCDRLLPTIPSVVSYASGRHVDTGRARVSSGYDLALRVGFTDVQGYQDYLVHPAHLELLALWNERFEQVVIYDIGD